VTGTINASAADVILNGQSAGDEFGIVVASAGDFNGDLKDDVIVSAFNDDNNGETDSGSAFIFFGGVTGTINADNADVIINGQSAGDQLSLVASAGNFNGDGKDDVLVAAGGDDGNATDSGRAFIFFGRDPGGTQLTLRVDADADVILNGQNTGDAFGAFAAAGDFNGDGVDDVYVGAVADDNNSKTNSGSGFIFFGQSPVSQLILTADADADVILNGQGAGDFFGRVASAGDVNGDGKDDIIVGATQQNLVGSGRAYVFFGRDPGGTQLTLRVDADADVVLKGQGEDDLFGFSVASAGNFNGDGKDDVIVGAAFDDNNGDRSGSAFIFFNPEPAVVVTANAGPDQTVDEGVLVTLDGTASTHFQGSPLNYDWSQVAGEPAVTLDLTNRAQPTFTAPFVSTNQTLTFELRVDDGTNFSEPDSVDIVVVNVNTPPVADAGNDGTIKPGAVATLDGSNSFDSESDPITYQWTQVDGTLVTLSDNTAQQPIFTAPNVVGDVLVFKLQVSDGKESSTLSVGTDSAQADTVAVNIVENSRPVADAGPDQTRDEGSSVSLDGSGSSDPDGGDVITFLWTQTVGTPVTLSATTSSSPTFTAPAIGPGGEDFTFQLVVSDDDPVNPLSSIPDDVTIHVANINDPPSCNLAVASPEKLWPPNHKMKPVDIDGVMDTDAEFNDVTLEITGVTQDEAVNGLGDGDTSPDAVIQVSDPRDSVLLRTERSGTGNGRVYQVGFTASDGFESCIGSVQVTVPHSRKSTATDDGQTTDSTLP